MRRQLVTRTVIGWTLGAVLALSPLASFALGLGKLQIKSALNEPLNAEIDITSITDTELRGLQVSLASRADYEAAGVERIPLLSRIKFNVARRPDGRYYLHLTTDAPIEEPFLHMLLQLEWPGGRLVREYTALIDPPNYVAGAPAPTEAPQIAPAPSPSAPEPSRVEVVPPPVPTAQSEPRLATPAAPVPAPLPEPSTQSVETIPSPAPAGQAREVTVAPTQPPADATPSAVRAAQDWANTIEYTVRPGDTLWSIAERVRADRQLTLEQVMLAIFRNNPDAFFRNNVNNLYAGKVLKIPERDDVEAMPAGAARREFRAQYAAWREYKLKLAESSRTLTVAESAAPAADGSGKEASSQAAADKTDARPAAQPTEQELLRIVRAAPDAEQKQGSDKAAESESTTADREQTALADRVTTLEESLQSKQLEHRELAEKVGQVREQLKNEKRLLEIENQALAQQTAKPAEAPSPPQAEAKPEAKPEATPPKRDAQATPAEPVKTPPRRPIQRPAPPPPVEDKGFFASLVDDLLDNTFAPLVGGIVVLLGGVILIIYLRRRRRSIAEFEESILASDAIATDVVTTTGTADTTTSQAVTTSGDTSFLSDFSKGGMGQVHTDEVDPIAEAEVYLAYGRDETAEEILKEAIVKYPERHELKQKLLEIYHQRNDVNAFETLAEELYAALGGRGGKIWEKVEEMGYKLNPENPMFRGGAPGERRAAEAPPAHAMNAPAEMADRGSVVAAAATVAAGAAAAGVAETQVVESAPSFDIDFDVPPKSADSGAGSNTIDFDLNMDLTPDTGGSKGAADGSVDFESLDLGAPASNLIDFDGGKSELTLDSPIQDTTASSAAGDEIKWEFDTPAESAAGTSADAGGESGNGAADAHWDETATKLDLARAYIDMGDAEGARSILDEVLAEGNEQQKQQARELAAQIA